MLEISDRMGRQMRAARQLLGWTRKDLAYVSEVSSVTLAGIEGDKMVPSAEVLKKIREAFEEAGVDFLNESERFGVAILPNKKGAKK